MSNPGELSHYTHTDDGNIGEFIHPEAIVSGMGQALNAVVNMMETNGQLGAALAFRSQILADPKHPVRQLRRKMIADVEHGEISEYLSAEFANDHEEIMDGGIDSLIVIMGMLLSYYPVGCILECAAEVTRANNDKFNGKHGPTIFDGQGKMLKPEGWVGPQLRPILEKYGIPLESGDSFVAVPEERKRPNRAERRRNRNATGDQTAR